MSLALPIILPVDVLYDSVAYSFAKTPLKAAHAPLAAASGIQGSLAIAVVVFEGETSSSGWVGLIASGMRGSASVSMAAEVDGDGLRILRRAMVVDVLQGSFAR